eukprot:m51a1_g8776 putative uvb-resistance 8 (431) ;mRNA; f:177876-179651
MGSACSSSKPQPSKPQQPEAGADSHQQAPPRQASSRLEGTTGSTKTVVAVQPPPAPAPVAVPALAFGALPRSVPAEAQEEGIKEPPRDAPTGNLSQRGMSSGPLFSVSGLLYSFGKKVVEGDPAASRGFMQVINTFVGLKKRVASVSCGTDHALAVLASGELYTWGDNCHGQLGLGDLQNRNRPELVSFFAGKKITRIACGCHHTIALLDTREVFSWGYNSEGELGLGDTVHRNTPQDIAMFKGKRVSEISCGDYHNLLLVGLSGDLFVWGHNSTGKLGIGAGPNQLTPVQNTEFKAMDDCIVSIGCGKGHSAAVLENGELYTWGNNTFGQLGHGDTLARDKPTLVTHFKQPAKVSMIACGGECTGAMLDNSEFYMWGCNSHGELALGHIKHKTLPQKVSPPGSTAADPHSGQKITGLACGWNFSIMGTK